MIDFNKVKKFIETIFRLVFELFLIEMKLTKVPILIFLEKRDQTKHTSNGLKKLLNSMHLSYSTLKVNSKIKLKAFLIQTKKKISE